MILKTIKPSSLSLNLSHLYAGMTPSTKTVSSTQEPHLSTLEQISPQAYTRFILCFRLSSGVSPDEVIQTLRKGLEATAAEIPVLKSQVISVSGSNGRETKDLRQRNAAIFSVRKLADNGMDFEKIRSQGFPSHVFDGEMLCPTAVFAAPGSEVPVFLAQANLITGGLLLAFSFWHQAFDGTAITTTLRLWAQNCCAVQDQNNNGLNPSNLQADAFDKSRLSKDTSKNGRKLEDHPEFILLPDTPVELPPALTQALKTQIFYFSPTSISALKELASPENSAKAQNKYSWTSTYVAVSALVWRSVMAATYAHQLPVTDSVCIFTSPLNARPRMDPPLTPDFIASAFCFHESKLPVNELLESSLADVALIVRERMDSVDAKYIDSLISMIDGVPKPSLLMPLAFTDVLRTCSILTSWAGFRMYDFDWGSTLGGKCERVRSVASGMFNGMQVVLPELTQEMGGGLEIVIGLENDAMERMKGDELWMRFARLL